jgi:Ca2+-binding RTX toxin-like protein
MASIKLRSEDLDFLLHLVLDPNGVRDVGGSGNNIANPDFGADNTPLVRLAPNAFDDGISAPRSLASDGTPLPNERTVSNLISTPDENGDGREEAMPNTFGSNVLLTAFGQFFDHGLDFIKRGNETYTIPLAVDDVLYNVDPTKGPIVTSITLSRGAEATGTGADGTPRQHLNEPSAYVDQSQTYGSHKAITYYLRESARDAAGNLIRDADGLLVKTAHLLSGGQDGGGYNNLATYRDILLNNGVSQSTINLAIAQNNFHILEQDPNFVAFSNTADPLTGIDSGHSLLIDISYDADPHLAGGRFFKIDTLLSHYVAGDGRVNENISLTPIHTIWHREHDYQVDRITEMVQRRSDAALWTPDVIFEAAKIIVEGEYQRVVYTEFLDAMAGGINGSGSHGFGGYDPTVDASISEEFAHAVYRVGHSMVNETVPYIDANGETQFTSLVGAYLNPTAYALTGIDSLLAGSIEVLHEAIDENLVNAVRNQLVGQPLDLGAINIARGREVGIMSLNDFRRYVHDNGTLLGSAGSDFTQDAKGDSSLRPYRNWDEFAANLRDPSLIEQFKQLYHSVDDVDLWIGGLAEKPAEGQLGSTFAFVFREQLDRLQDGDRFYYLDRLDGAHLLSDMKSQEFADIIMRNSGLTGLTDVFKATNLGAANVANAGFIHSLKGDTDANALMGSEGADTMQGAGGDDTVNGLGGNDTLSGGDGNDSLVGGDGSDILNGDAGSDRMAGGRGDDVYFVDNLGDMVSEEPGEGIDVVSSTISYMLGSQVENLTLTGMAAISGTGNSLDNILFGNGATNFLSGGDGADTLRGGAGNDTIDGGAGHDVASFSGTRAQTTLTYNDDRSWTVTGPDGIDVLWDVEAVRFTDAQFTLLQPQDVDRQNKSDILWCGQDGEVAVWQMDGDQIASAGVVDANPGAHWAMAGTGDFGGDGRADILWRGQDGEVAVWQMEGDQIASAGVVDANPGAHWAMAGTGDFGGDGRADILWRGQDGEIAVWQMEGDQIASAGVVDANPGAHWAMAGTGDFGGDGRADILWRGQDGEVALWQMDGDKITSASVVDANPGAYWAMAGTGDFDGDGRTDILWRGQDGEVALWQMDGDKITSASVLDANPGAYWAMAGISDFGGDGRADILWRGQDGEIALWQMDGDQIASASVMDANPGAYWAISL